jgi:hypothetical protein
MATPGAYGPVVKPSMLPIQYKVHFSRNGYAGKYKAAIEKMDGQR